MRSQISRIDEQRRLRPDRPMVTKWFGTWDVWAFLGGRVRVKEFPTHADAIEYAHEQATRQTLAARFNIPPENPSSEPPC